MGQTADKMSQYRPLVGVAKADSMISWLRDIGSRMYDLPNRFIENGEITNSERGNRFPNIKSYRDKTF
jgi:hypothetical protein